jgi:hypothetical protein
MDNAAESPTHRPAGQTPRRRFGAGSPPESFELEIEPLLLKTQAFLSQSLAGLETEPSIQDRVPNTPTKPLRCSPTLTPTGSQAPPASESPSVVPELPTDLTAPDFLEQSARVLSNAWSLDVVLALTDTSHRVVRGPHGWSPHSAPDPWWDQPSCGVLMQETSQSALPLSSAMPQNSSEIDLTFGASRLFRQIASERPDLEFVGAGFPYENSARSNRVRLVLLVAWSSGAVPASRPIGGVVEQLARTGPNLAHACQLWWWVQLGQCPTWKSRMTRLWSKYQRRWVAVVVGVAAILLFIPIPYLPTRPCIIEPGSRGFVASPLDGKLESSEVRPGDRVVLNQMLATLDGSQLRREQASAQAELQEAIKRRSSARANRSGGELAISQYEQAQAQLKLESIEAKLADLEIRSPIEGVLVQGDWHGRDGAPLSIGQMLFEIAPLDQMTAQVHLSTQDLSQISVGTEVVVFTDDSGMETWRGKLTRINPRAELIEEKAVFVAEMPIDNSSNQLRPGMKAYARLDVGNRTVGWLLFRGPLQWLRNLVTW